MPRPSELFDLHPKTHGFETLKTHEFDVVCIGSGWAARMVARQVIKAGYTAILVEKELFGGECPFWACVPSKVLLRSQEALNAANSVGGARERLTNDGVDVKAVFARRDAITAAKDDTKVLVPALEALGATLLRGTARLSGVRRVTVADTQGASISLTARLAVAVCSGSEAVIPESVAGVNPWTARDATSASCVPSHLVIMGGGVVGCEMASAYADFGSQVTIISSSKYLLPSLDPDAGELLRKSLEKRGVVVLAGIRVSGATRINAEQIQVSLSDGNTVHGTELLVAAGRRSVTDIGLAEVGVDLQPGKVEVDTSFCVKTPDNEKWLYAPGDINGLSAFTHGAKYHGRIAGNAILAQAVDLRGTKPPPGSYVAKADSVAMPQVILTRPIVASVGLTQAIAAKQGKSVRRIIAPAISLGGKLHSDSLSDGWAQWLVDDEDRLVGMSLVGEDAAELLHAGTVAIVAGMKLSDLFHAIPSFPTMSEVYLNLLEAAGF